MIEYHDPQANSSVAVTPYQLGISLATGRQITVGLLANGFPDSENFLNLVAEALAIEVPGISFARYNKGNASIPANDEILSGIASQCQAVITAYGHWGSCTTGTVRDGIAVARSGIPAVALVTTDYWPQGDFVANSLGMPGVPRVKLPHPVAGSGVANMRNIARQVLPAIIQALAGETPVPTRRDS